MHPTLHLIPALVASACTAYGLRELTYLLRYPSPHNVQERITGAAMLLAAAAATAISVLPVVTWALGVKL